MSFDIPLHPLFVHFGVTFLCVFALFCLAVVISPAIRRWSNFLLSLLAVATATIAFITKQTGEMLGHQTHDVNWHSHGDWGDLAAMAGILLSGCAVLLWMSESSRMNRYDFSKSIQQILAKPLMFRGVCLAIIICSVATLIFTFIAGHTGAELVWLES